MAFKIKRIHALKLNQLKKMKYFHELPQEEINLMIENGSNWNDILKNYKQPKWCGYYEALSGVLGCWSLTDIKENGFRTKISESFCDSCESKINNKKRM